MCLTSFAFIAGEKSSDTTALRMSSRFVMHTVFVLSVSVYTVSWVHSHVCNMKLSFFLIININVCGFE